MDRQMYGRVLLGSARSSRHVFSRYVFNCRVSRASWMMLGQQCSSIQLQVCCGVPGQHMQPVTRNRDGVTGDTGVTGGFVGKGMGWMAATCSCQL